MYESPNSSFPPSKLSPPITSSPHFFRLHVEGVSNLTPDTNSNSNSNSNSPHDESENTANENNNNNNTHDDESLSL